MVFVKGNVPWIQGRHHSKESNENNRLSHLGKKLSEEHKKRISEGNKGREVSENTRRKISVALKGRHCHSEEARQKMSLTRKGRIPWIQGRHHSEETRKKISESHKGKKVSDETRLKMMGHIPPNKGKKMSLEYRRKLSIVHKGYRLSEAHKIKLSLASTGKKHTEATKEKLKQLWAKNIKRKKEYSLNMKLKRKNIIVPTRDTSIEVRIQSFLKELGIPFFTHQYRKEIQHGYQCDVFIPSMNLVIECDGDFWHNYPTGTELDHIRTSELIAHGFKVLRLWEREIKVMTVNDFKKRL